MINQPKQAERMVRDHVKFFFALLSCLGGLILVGDPETHSFAIIAIFFACFGFVFVDWLKFFSLPPLIAYAAMLGSALYCISDFINFKGDGTFLRLQLYRSGDRHLVAVAQLLVLVQAVLMLQPKSRRVCEQLCVFCLLELIVAAVFNDALSFGLLLIPIGFVAAFGLALLSAESPGEESEDSPEIKLAISTLSKYRLIGGLGITLVPAVVLIAATFFYSVPRTTDAAQATGHGQALVGFSDVVHLKQFGLMQQSSEIALRAWLTNGRTREPYHPIGGVYLRGRVMESYQTNMEAGERVADWTSLQGGPISNSQLLPTEYHAERSSDKNFYDTVHVSIECNPMRSASLFAIAPYFRLPESMDIRHQVDRWMIRRLEMETLTHPQIQYAFGTNAFHRGIQSNLIPRFSESEGANVSDRFREKELDAFMDTKNAFSLSREQAYIKGYRRELLRFEESKMPTIKLMADAIVSSFPDNKREPIEIAEKFEEFLSVTGGFDYTLNLDGTKSQVDPIERFIATDRRGNCQYFASALVMMLRSQGIPARIVLGYRTDEYNDLGNYYIARQSHAHSWVEALIDRNDIHEAVYGHPEAKQYWLRLDPTPAASVTPLKAQGVGNVIDLAQTWWKNNVVDISVKKKPGDSKPNAGMIPVADTSQSILFTLQRMIDTLRTGDLGKGGFAMLNPYFGFLITVMLPILFLAGVWFRRRRFRSRERSRNTSVIAERPSIHFYAAALDCLASVGISRKYSQTPEELLPEAERVLRGMSPMDRITRCYYQMRFGNEPEPTKEIESSMEELRKRVSDWKA